MSLLTVCSDYVHAFMCTLIAQVGGVCFSSASDIEPTSQHLFSVEFVVRLSCFCAFLQLILHSSHAID